MTRTTGSLKAIRSDVTVIRELLTPFGTGGAFGPWVSEG